MIRFLVRRLANALAIYLATYFIFDFNFPIRLPQDWKLLLLAGFILAILNTIIRPILKLISAPLIILTLGLFTVIINMATLWLLTQFVPEITIVGIWAYFWATIIISLTNWIVGSFLKKESNA
jgi:putative membrane protein